MKLFLFFTMSMLILISCDRRPAKKTDSGVPDRPNDLKELSSTDAEVAVSKAYSQFIDVRTTEEYAGGHAARAQNIPLEVLLDNLSRLEKSEPVYVIGQNDSQSKEAAKVLKAVGFNNVVNVTGGMDAWQAAGLPVEKLQPHRVPPVPISNNGPRS